MSRMIAVKTITGYRAARIEYDREDLLDILEQHWSTAMSIQGLIAQGDMLTLTERGGMRVARNGKTRTVQDLAGLIAISSEEGVHCITIFDDTMATYDQFAEWNMTCEAGDDLFLENIATAGPWHHLIDGKKVEEALQRAA